MLACPPCDAKNAWSAARNASQAGGRRQHPQRVALVVLDRQQASRPQRRRQLRDRGRPGPARTGTPSARRSGRRRDGAARRRPGACSTPGRGPARRRRARPAMRSRKTGDGSTASTGPPHAAPQLAVQRPVAGTDLEHAPAPADAQPVEQRKRRRIPEARLRPQARRFGGAVSEQVFVGARTPPGHVPQYGVSRPSRPGTRRGCAPAGPSSWCAPAPTASRRRGAASKASTYWWRSSSSSVVMARFIEGWSPAMNNSAAGERRASVRQRRDGGRSRTWSVTRPRAAVPDHHVHGHVHGAGDFGHLRRRVGAGRVGAVGQHHHRAAVGGALGHDGRRARNRVVERGRAPGFHLAQARRPRP